jgi:hypothetical protein
MRGAFKLKAEQDVLYPNTPMPLNVEQYVVLTYNNTNTTATLYLNGAQVGVNTNITITPASMGNTFDNWIGRDQYGDPVFDGSVDELRIWNAASSALYIAVSAVAGPNVLVTNLMPEIVNVAVPGPSMNVGQNQQATVSANFLQATNVPLNGVATNWSSTSTNVLTVNSAGLITAVGVGSAIIKATVGGVISAGISITVSSSSAGVVTTVGYWPFTNSANLGMDVSGLGNNLTTAGGAPSYSSEGMFGGSLYLNGSSTLSTLSGAFPIGVPTNANPYTIAVWEKIDTGCPNNGGFVGWGVNNTSGANDFRLSGPNSVDDYWYNNDFIVSSLAVNPMDGNWHALAVTWDGTNQMMYVDGVNVGNPWRLRFKGRVSSWAKRRPM